MDSPYTVEHQEDGTKKYKCTSCSKTFNYVKSVTEHYRNVHLRKRPKIHACNHCGVRIAGTLRAKHLETEHGIPAPTCNACGKKFAYPFQVLRHQKQDHMGEKKFDCNNCDLKFKTQANLNRHLVKHSSERKHKCNICDKAFRWKSNLTVHIKMHKNERHQTCPVCQDSFVQRASLTYHITKKHPELV